jgi:hypothetical protein
VPLGLELVGLSPGLWSPRASSLGVLSGHDIVCCRFDIRGPCLNVRELYEQKLSVLLFTVACKTGFPFVYSRCNFYPGFPA